MYDFVGKYKAFMMKDSYKSMIKNNALGSSHLHYDLMLWKGGQQVCDLWLACHYSPLFFVPHFEMLSWFWRSIKFWISENSLHLKKSTQMKMQALTLISDRKVSKIATSNFCIIYEDISMANSVTIGPVIFYIDSRLFFKCILAYFTILW